MQPHFGIANISISGDVEAGLGYIHEAQALLRIVLEQMRVRHLQQFSMQRSFDDKCYAHVTCAGGYNLVRIVCGQPQASGQQPFEPKFPVDVPDFLSGVVEGGTLTTVPANALQAQYDVLNNFCPTQPCAKLFGLPFAPQPMRRLAVEPADGFGSLQSPNEFQRYSQYVRLKPTMYSGLMKRLVQTLMGFGFQNSRGKRETSIYDLTKPKAKVSRKQRVSITPYQQSVQQHGLQILYDWHFSRTHGLVPAADGKLWIVEISITQGVIAMPLPLNANSMKPEFRAKLEAMGDDAGLAVLDQFGGFPTGEGFPPTEQISAWLRAGKLIRLCTKDELAPFYQCSSYSDEMGWAFNLSGTEAHNTAYYYDNQNVMHGVHYMVPIYIGSSESVTPNASAAGLKKAFKTLRSNPQYKDSVDAALWKLDRLSDFDLQDAAELNDGSSSGLIAAFKYVDGLDLGGIATATGHLSLSDDGYLYNPSKTGNLIKFPDADLGLLRSIQMRPDIPNPIAASKLCDTMVHVFFAGDEMKWVKYYRNPFGSLQGSHDDDFEDCMYIGSWSSHDDNGTIAVTDALYTNDLDDRAELPGSSSDTIITGTDMGYQEVYVIDDITFPAYGTLSRKKRFRIKTETRTISGEGLGTGVIVPFYDREAYYYAKLYTDHGTSHSISYDYKELVDPYSCSTWRNFPGYIGQWVEIGNGGDYRLIRAVQHPNGCGPVTDRTVWANPEAPVYSPGPCSDIADSGPWCHTCDDADRMTYSIPSPPQPPSLYESTSGTLSIKVWLVADGNFGQLLTYSQDDVAGFGDWPLHSPQTDPNFSSDQYAEETHNAMGEAAVIRYSATVNAGVVLRGGPQLPGTTAGSLTYIGVLDG